MKITGLDVVEMVQGLLFPLAWRGHVVLRPVVEAFDQILCLTTRHESRALAIDYEAYCVDLGGQG